jgi:proteic killer suppression protein
MLAFILTSYVIRHIVINMIKNFKCKDTEKLFNDFNVKKFRSISKIARIKLELLNATVSLNSLRIPPGNRLEQLKGDRKSQRSIRINDQWRICFIWSDEDAYDVEIVDYH